MLIAREKQNENLKMKVPDTVDLAWMLALERFCDYKVQFHKALQAVSR